MAVLKIKAVVGQASHQNPRYFSAYLNLLAATKVCVFLQCELVLGTSFDCNFNLKDHMT